MSTLLHMRDTFESVRWKKWYPYTERRGVICLRLAPIADTLISDIRVAGWDVQVVENAYNAQKMVDKNDFCVGLVLLGHEGYTDAYRQMEELALANRHTLWIALLPAEFERTESVCRLITRHFCDYHTLPVDLERLLITLGHAYGMAQMRHQLQEASQARIPDDNSELIGTSPPMQTLLRQAHKAALVDVPVLITGESGTGKELVTRAIHQQSARSDGPFVPVNCGALPGALIHSELFGHEKGAFTGAHQRRRGRFELAAQGTLFLDEIGDLPLDLQVNLLRFLEEKSIERLGGTDRIAVNVRVIAATHVDLKEAVAEGRFREDLYYRLNVVHLNMPSLRQREGDIELLARFFFKKFAAENSNSIKGFSEQALQVLEQYNWPGNVRELMNRIHHAMVMCDGDFIKPSDLGLDRRAKRQAMNLEEARAMAEKQVIASTLRWTRKNVSQAARELGISRPTLYRMMKKYGIEI